MEFTGERVVPGARNCEPSLAKKIYQEHIARYRFALHFVQGRDVLDVGCGVGYGANFLAENGAGTVLAFDVSGEAIEHGKTHFAHDRVEYAVWDAERFDAGRKFDVTTCFELIEHVKAPDRVLDNIVNHLGEEGVLLLSTPRNTGEKRSSFHEKEMNYSALRAMLSRRFEFVSFFYQNNLYVTHISDSKPLEKDFVKQTMEGVEVFGRNGCDVFICVASNDPIEMPPDVLLFNDESYVKNLEHDKHVIEREMEKQRHSLLVDERETVDLASKLDSMTSACEKKGLEVRELDRKNTRLELHLSRAEDDLNALKRELEEKEKTVQELSVERSELCESLEKTRNSVEQEKKELQDATGKCAELREALERTRLLAEEREFTLTKIYTSHGWRALSAYYAIRNRVFPPHTRRKRMGSRVFRLLSGGTTANAPEGEPHTTSIPEETGLELPQDVAEEEEPSTPQVKTLDEAVQCDALYIVGCIEGESKRYRVFNMIEALSEKGFHCEAAYDFNIPELIQKGFHAKALVLFRLGHSDHVESLVKHCRKHGIPVVFDVDDLVFEPQSVDFVRTYALMSQKQKQEYMRGVNLYRKTLLLCDMALTTTEFLADRIRKLGIPAHVIPNTLNREQLALAERLLQRKREREDSKFRMGYFPGTRTHEVDFKDCEAALLRFVRENENARFIVCGDHELGPEWKALGHQVEERPFTPYMEMQALMATLDLAIAPLERKNPFTEGKSQVKIIEPAIVEVPTIASDTAGYREGVSHGIDGFLARSEEEWLRWLRLLMKEPETRKKAGNLARKRVLHDFSPESAGSRSASILDLDRTPDSDSGFNGGRNRVGRQPTGATPEGRECLPDAKDLLTWSPEGTSSGPTNPDARVAERKALSEIYLSNTASWFRVLLTERTKKVLDALARTDDLLGATDNSALNMLASFVRTLQPERVLQLGTHCGFSAIVLADILNTNSRKGQLFTVDINLEAHQRARRRISEAGLNDVVTFLDGDSTEEKVLSDLVRHGPFDFMYIDSSHTYKGTLRELEIYLGKDTFLKKHAVILLHDAGITRKKYNEPLDGGVPRAVREFVTRFPLKYPAITLDVPVWPNPCGLALLVKVPHTPSEGSLKTEKEAPETRDHQSETFVPQALKISMRESFPLYRGKPRNMPGESPRVSLFRLIEEVLVKANMGHPEQRRVHFGQILQYLKRNMDTTFEGVNPFRGYSTEYMRPSLRSGNDIEE